jgi:phenylalanyl-tRNA synthetase beta chain
MKISCNWLKEFVEVPAAPDRLKTDLTSLGLGVESVAPAEDDTVFDLEVTTNRPDCLSHYGVARELAALYHLPLKPIHLSLKEVEQLTSSHVAVEIADQDLCARYCARVIRNVTVKPSPAWLERRLEAAGVRSINNVADATNYVLLELGHPLHAFDLARIRQGKIIVRRARPGETLRTLDGVDRVLQADQLVIADAAHASALAGIMGGRTSEITFGTQAVLLESAWFNPLSIRHTSKAQGLHTEASHRFERGADIEMAPVALDRAATLIQELAGGEVLRGMVDIYPRRFELPQICLCEQEIRRILGAEIPAEEVDRILRALHFKVQAGDDGSRRITPPSFRLDVSREVDLIEEIARHFGYDRLPTRLRAATPPVEADFERQKVLALSNALTGLGYREIVTTTLVDPKEDAAFADTEPVIVTNPLSQDAAALQRSTVTGMIRALRWNLDRGQANLAFFEFGKVYFRDQNGKPVEKRRLTLGRSGFRRPPSVHDSARELDFFDLKGDLENVLALFDPGSLAFVDKAPAYYNGVKRGSFEANGQRLASFGDLDAEIERGEKLRQIVWFAEIDLEVLLEFPLRSLNFKPYSKFPAAGRDFSLIVPDRVRYAEIERTIARLELPELRNFQPLDRFRGGAIAPGHYSLLLRATFQAAETTLTSEAVSEASAKILDALAPLGIELRPERPREDELRGKPTGEEKSGG